MSELCLTVRQHTFSVVTYPDSPIRTGRLGTNCSDAAVSRRTTAEGHNLVAIIELFSAVRSLLERRREDILDS